MSSKKELDYDMGVAIERLRQMGRSRYDGLKLLRLISPEIDPSFNDQVSLAKSHTKEQMAYATNRSGKSTPSAAKIAAVARDVPLIAWNGEEINCRPEHQRDQTLTIWVVGYHLSHIGQTIFRLLFQPGAFKIIRDPDTNAWRAWMPWQKYDAENRHLVKDGPPFIPPQEIDHDSWVWESKGAKQVTEVRLKNGTQFYFYPSSAEVKKGDPVHVIWIDELIQTSEHYAEWIMRLLDYQGWLLWSTAHYRRCPAISWFKDAAEMQAEEVRRGEREAAFTTVIPFRTEGNPYNLKEEIDISREILARTGDDAVTMRIEGGDVFDSTLIYPFFDKSLHCAIPEDKAEWDDLAEVLSMFGGVPPRDWTHELIIDPGAQKPAILFCAVPPQHWTHEGREYRLWAGPNEPYFVPYEEIYGRRYNLHDQVQEVVKRSQGIRFRRFIIDMQAGRQSPLTGGPRYVQLYSKAFADAGLECEETGVNFISGDKDFTYRRRIVDEWMRTKGRGWPQLRIVTQRCPNLVWQLQRNQLAMDGDRVVQDKEARRELNDLRVNLEYWASRSPKYVHIDHQRVVPQWVERFFEVREELFGRKRQGEGGCHFGPGLAPGYERAGVA